MERPVLAAPRTPFASSLSSFNTHAALAMSGGPSSAAVEGLAGALAGVCALVTTYPLMTVCGVEGGATKNTMRCAARPFVFAFLWR